MDFGKCLYCGVPVVQQMYVRSIVINENGNHISLSAPYGSNQKPAYRIHHYRCPNCEKYTVYLEGLSEPFNSSFRIFPQSLAPTLPDYIPLAIRQDFSEAYAIKDLSPKASATLSRRCLQGMIRDFFGIKENNLAAEIEKIKDQISPVVRNALDDVRQLGNIGAHMEQDINLIIDITPYEADRLLSLIQFLLKAWYIERHDAELLLDEVNQINQKKQSERSNSSS